MNSVVVEENRLAVSMTGSARLVTMTADDVRPDTLDHLMTFTRQAYANSDPLPGLPTPDGAVEDVEHLTRFLADGGNLQVLRTHQDVLALSRTTSLPDGALWVSRVAVAPAARGTGVGAVLMARIEELAAARGHRAVRLDAVIERCLMPYYAALGYRITGYHLPEDGKPLTEAAMERDLTRPRVPMSWRGPDPGATRTIAWYATTTGTTALLSTGAEPAPHSAGGLAGLDAWLGHPEALPDLLHAAPGARSPRDPRTIEFATGRAAVALHVRPRTVHGDLWALVRFLPGRERPRSEHFLSAPHNRTEE